MIFSSFRWNKSTRLDLSHPTRAYVYYRYKRLNLLTGFPEAYPLKSFLHELEEFKLSDPVELPRVYHFYYEFGLVLSGLGHQVGDEAPLAVEIEYRQKKKMKTKASRLKEIKLKTLERPTWTEYKEAFARVQEHLLAGNCYQVNLTFPYDFETEEALDPRDIRDFFLSRKGLGAYAHVSYFGENMIVSSSPECLFQYEKGRLFTMPIKGTIKDTRHAWKTLCSDEKQEGELFMIVDLLRNDLNRLDQPRARVRKLKAPLRVPGLLHQYSLIDIKLSDKVSVLKTLESLFPGGSITGAPKKKVMQIIHEVERHERNLYTGTTMLCYGEKKVASINIRTAQVSTMDRLWRYGAGGGVTLLSRNVGEFQEMESKVQSFLTLTRN